MRWGSGILNILRLEPLGIFPLIRFVVPADGNAKPPGNLRFIKKINHNDLIELIISTSMNYYPPFAKAVPSRELYNISHQNGKFGKSSSTQKYLFLGDMRCDRFPRLQICP